MKKALFLDRDGVINRMVLINGQFDSPQNIKQIFLVPGITSLIEWLNKKGVLIIEVTNQPGVALGKISFKDLDKVENKIHKLLNKDGVKVDKIFRCIHHPNSLNPKFNIACNCRKPKAGMLIKAAKQLNIDLKGSAILGDNATDMEAGKKAGCKTILFYHEEDTLEKIAAKRNSQFDFRVTSHQQALSIIKELFE